MSCFSGIKNTICENFHAVIHEDPSQSLTCRFRNLDSSVPMMEPAKDRGRNNVSELLYRACAGCVLLERNMRSRLVIIDGIFRKDSAKVLRIERDQMIRAPARTDPIKRSTYPFCQGERNEVSRMRYLGAVSHENASLIWRASHSAVGFWATTNHNSCRRRWPRTRNMNSCRKALVGTITRSIDAISSR